MVKKLLDAGIRLESVRDVFAYLREHMDTDVASAHLVIYGNRRAAVRRATTLIDVVRRGQGVLNVLPLAGVKEELDEGIVGPPPSGGGGRRRAEVGRRRSRLGEPVSGPRARSPLDGEPPRARAPRWCRSAGGRCRWPTRRGTLAEHLACRQRRGRVRRQPPRHRARRGRGALDDAAGARSPTTSARSAPGRAQYTHLLDPDDASVLDDIIVWWVDDERFDVMPNASNTERVRAPRSGADDVTGERAIIAVQGPRRGGALEAVAPEAAAVGRFRVAPLRRGTARPASSPAPATRARTASRSPCPPRPPPTLWRAVLAAGVERRRGWAPATPCGWRPPCRCTATSSGPGITPLQAGSGLGRVVDQADVPGPGRARGRAGAGRAPAAAGHQRPRGGDRRGRSARCASRAPSAGETTSGNFSPVLGHGIALAFLPPDGGARARPSRSTCGARPWPAPWSPPRSSARRDGGGSRIRPVGAAGGGPAGRVRRRPGRPRLRRPGRARSRPGDRLVVVQDTGDLLHVPAADHALADAAVGRGPPGLPGAGPAPDAAITAFFDGFARRLEDDGRVRPHRRRQRRRRRRRPGAGPLDHPPGAVGPACGPTWSPACGAGATCRPAAAS